jgi:predicted nucleotidyltransferase
MDSPATDEAVLPLRQFLLIAARDFVDSAAKLNGIARIAMLGSLLTTKTEPKDADVLVTVKDGIDLTALARLARRLKGRTQTRNHGADIFLADESARYIGRVCHRRERALGIRRACAASGSGPGAATGALASADPAGQVAGRRRGVRDRERSAIREPHSAISRGLRTPIPGCFMTWV